MVDRVGCTSFVPGSAERSAVRRPDREARRTWPVGPCNDDPGAPADVLVDGAAGHRHCETCLSVIELDVDARIGTQILDVGHRPGRDHITGRRRPEDGTNRIRSGRTEWTPDSPSNRLRPHRREVRRADEVSRHERRGRLVVESHRGVPTCSRRPRLNTATRETHRQRLTLVVRHEHERDPHLAFGNCAKLDLHLLAELEIERAQRLVEEQDRRPIDERPGRGDPLPLSARQLVGHADCRSRLSRTISSTSPTRRRRSRDRPA